MSINKKLLDVQKEIKPIVKDSTNPHFKNTYFDINTLLAEVKPILNKHGLVLLQALTTTNDGRLGLSTKISLVEENTQPSAGISSALIPTMGKEIEFTCPLPECTDAQKYGSAITYFRRYALQSLLALEAEDDDGNTAKTPANPPQPSTAAPLQDNNDLAF